MKQLFPFLIVEENFDEKKSSFSDLIDPGLPGPPGLYESSFRLAKHIENHFVLQILLNLEKLEDETEKNPEFGYFLVDHFLISYPAGKTVGDIGCLVSSTSVGSLSISVHYNPLIEKIYYPFFSKFNENNEMGGILKSTRRNKMIELVF